MLVALLAPLEAHALELSAITEAFALANEHLDEPSRYSVSILVADLAAPLDCSSGLRLLGDEAFGTVEGVDTLIVIGAAANPAPSPEMIGWLRRQAQTTRRWGALGTGIFLLGAAGLLDGRRVTTHWQHADDLAMRYPAAIIDRDRIYVRDGPLFTGAGESAAIDLVLALIEEDHGRETALQVGHSLVVYLKRAGGESQHSVQLAGQSAERSSIERVHSWIRENPASDLSVNSLAQIAAMSPRNFARVFRRETGVSPAAFVESTRMEIARRLLEDTDLSPQRVALQAGFVNHDAARRAFLRLEGVTLAQYKMFRKTRPKQ